MNIETSIDRVTLFKSAALVTRKGKIPRLSITEGTIKLYIKNLPLILDDTSLRTSIPGKSSWAVRNVLIEIDRKDTEEIQEETLHILEKEQEKTKVEMAAADEQINLVNKWLKASDPSQKLSILKEINRKKYEKEKPLFHLESYVNFTKTCMDYLKKLHKKQEELNLTFYKGEEKIKHIKEILACPFKEENEDFKDFYKNLVITLGAMDRREFWPEEIEISYIIPGSMWVPLYKLYIQDNYKKVNLVMGGYIAQKSGEDWDKVKLSFSSVEINRKTQLPDLPSKLMGRAQPERQISFKERATRITNVYKDYDEWLEKEIACISGKKPLYEELINKCTDLYNDIKPLTPHLVKGKPATPPVFLPEPAPTVVYPKQEDAFFRRREAESSTVCAEQQAVYEEYEEYEEYERVKTRSPVIKADLLPCEKKSFGLGTMIGGAINALGDAVIPSGGGMKVDLLPAQQKSRRREIESEYIGFPCVEDIATTDYLSYEITGVEETVFEQRGILRKTRSLKVSEKIKESDEILLKNIGYAIEKSKISFPREVKESFHFIIEGKGRASIPSDGLPHTVTMEGKAAESSLEYSTFPLTEEKVFRRIVLKNPFPHPLPSGSVQVFIDNSYSLSTELSNAGSGGKAVFPLGVEEKIRVARNTSFYQEEKGIMGGVSSAQNSVEISLKSHMSDPVTVEVYDRTPVPAYNHKDITVEILKQEPKGEKIDILEGDIAKGFYKWNIPLEPGGTGSVKFTYEILISSKMEIHGGNRRL
ncbi:MAG: DUF4139 domain-containing protein [Candidatus Eremiobacterota bacterium]